MALEKAQQEALHAEEAKACADQLQEEKEYLHSQLIYLNEQNMGIKQEIAVLQQALNRLATVAG